MHQQWIWLLLQLRTTLVNWIYRVEHSKLCIRNEAGSQTVAGFQSPLQTLGLQGSAIVVLASGYLTPANNGNGPAFGLYASLIKVGKLVALTNTTSTGEIDLSKFKLFPNPANTDLFIQTTDNLPATVAISSTLGQTIMVKEGVTSQLNVSTLASGVYITEVKTTLGQSTQLSIKD